MWMFFILLLALSSPSYSQDLIPDIMLQCADEFPCPEGIQKRVKFWASVYKDFGASTAIFHDSKQPERVYSLLTSPDACTRSRGRREENTPVEMERTRIKSLLYDMANRLELKNQTWSTEEQRILNSFANKEPRELREAAENVRCQTGNKDMFEQGVARFEKYKDMVADAIKSQNLPPDIMFLPFVESSYNPRAMSRVGAAGMWQIMPSTARTLGLTVNSTVDERFDPELATKAAAKYLKQSFETLESAIMPLPWRQTQGHLGPFVITSYNYGVAGAKRMLSEVGLDFVRVLQDYNSRSAKVAVQNFYASFVAARHVATNRKIYFPNITPEKPEVIEKIIISSPLSARALLAAINGDEAKIRELNLSLSHRVWAGNKNIPVGFAFKVPVMNESAKNAVASLWKGKPSAVAAVESREEIYRVKKHDTACSIAKRFDVPCNELIARNQLGRKGIIRRNQILTIPITSKNEVVAKRIVQTENESPAKEPTAPVFKPASTSPTETPSPESVEEVASAFGLGLDLYVDKKIKKNTAFYSVTVQPEETLGYYSEWLGKSVAELSPKKSKRTIQSGQVITLPIDNDDQKRDFEKKRIDFHRTLEEEFKERYSIVGQESYKVRRGESEQKIAKDYDIPEWLLKRFNTDLNDKGLKAGMTLTIPIVERKNTGK